MATFVAYIVAHTLVGLALMGWVGTISPSWALWIAWPFWGVAYLIQLNARNLNNKLKNGLFIVHIALPAILAWILHGHYMWWRTFFFVNAVGVVYDVLSFTVTLSRIFIASRKQVNDDTQTEKL